MASAADKRKPGDKRLRRYANGAADTNIIAAARMAATLLAFSARPLAIRLAVHGRAIGRGQRRKAFTKSSRFEHTVDNVLYKVYRMYEIKERVTRMSAKRKEFTATEARSNFSEVFDAAFHEGPVIIRKNSKKVALVNLELLQMLAEFEESVDSKKADKALAEFLKDGGTPLKDLKKELGID